ncbi:hypothetical protein V1514DRAFT_329247 [Lipomyces japonicus]|uniref:uncharacterized protein n=1 Tax=Lipomyces japonicus TaxID=56871 RepID=UPI0034D01C6C
MWHIQDYMIPFCVNIIIIIILFSLSQALVYCRHIPVTKTVAPRQIINLSYWDVHYYYCHPLGDTLPNKTCQESQTLLLGVVLDLQGLITFS